MSALRLMLGRVNLRGRCGTRRAILESFARYSKGSPPSFFLPSHSSHISHIPHTSLPSTTFTMPPKAITSYFKPANGSPLAAARRTQSALSEAARNAIKAGADASASNPPPAKRAKKVTGGSSRPLPWGGRRLTPRRVLNRRLGRRADFTPRNNARGAAQEPPGAPNYCAASSARAGHPRRGLAHRAPGRAHQALLPPGARASETGEGSLLTRSSSSLSRMSRRRRRCSLRVSG